MRPELKPNPKLLPKNFQNSVVNALSGVIIKFQVISIRGLRFIIQTHPTPHTHIVSDKVIALSALPYYDNGADRYNAQTNIEESAR